MRAARRVIGLGAVLGVILTTPIRADAQQPDNAPRLTADQSVPIEPSQRVEWVVDGTIGIRSLGVGVFAASFQTAVDWPKEWGRSPSGFAKRYLEREADVAISNSLEAGIGAIFGEDPRYISSGRRGVWPRARWALKTAFVAPHRDGRLRPAWGRYAGNVVNNLIENSWLPPSATTWRQTTMRSVDGMLSRMAGNLWEEFWPDVRNRMKRRTTRPFRRT